MLSKTQIYAQMADDTARKITGDYLDWAAFLNTSSRLYKYPFHDQLMIYAQRPDATACATYDLWNDTMRRYIRRGSKGIALLTPGPYGMDVTKFRCQADSAECSEEDQYALRAKSLKQSCLSLQMIPAF